MHTINKNLVTITAGLKAGLIGLALTALSSQSLADVFYRVKAGDTLNSIAKQYGVSVQQLVDLNNLKSANDIKIGDMISLKDVNARNFQGQTAQYIVKSGDSFSSIAKKFNTSVATLAEINNFSNDKTLLVGERISVPFNLPASTITTKPGITISTVQPAPKTVTITREAPTQVNYYTYTVKTGDTLIGVADKFDVYTDALAKLNNLETTAMLDVGQKLLIPGSVDRLKALAEDKGVKLTTVVNKTAVTTPVKAAQVKTSSSSTVVSKALPKVNIVAYTVKSGDSLTALARRYNTTNAALARMNKIGVMDNLLVGQKILVPVQEGASVTAQATAEKY